MSRLALLAVTGLLAAGVTAAPPSCHEDNCYRAMFPCRPGMEAEYTIATEFCATITASGTTATNYPAEATHHCGFMPEMYLSVCGCGPNCTPAPTGVVSSTSSSSTAPPTPTCTPPAPASGVFYEETFDCGIGSMTPSTPDSSVSYTVTSDQGAYAGKALLIELDGASSLPSGSTSFSITGPSASGAAGVPSKLSFKYLFATHETGVIKAFINGAVVAEIDAADVFNSVWLGADIDFTPTTSDLVVSFEVVFGKSSTYLLIDEVDMHYLH